jgi:hypothetical protein
MRLKQRIIRILIEEIIADVDEAKTEIVLMIHWTGGRHSELRMKKNPTGKHSRCTSLEAIEIIRQMAGKFPDDQIAATLNRLTFRTGTGNTWTEGRIRSLRSYHEWPAYDAKTSSRQSLTLEEASKRLEVSHKVVRRLIDSGDITSNSSRALGALGDLGRSCRIRGSFAGCKKRKTSGTGRFLCVGDDITHVCGPLSGFSADENRKSKSVDH